jgi:hypothetical protein
VSSISLYSRFIDETQSTEHGASSRHPLFFFSLFHHSP